LRERVRPDLRATSTIRRANTTDAAALIALENSVFQSDRMSARQFRRHLHAPAQTTQFLIAERDAVVLGAACIFFRHAQRLARLYSLAVAPIARGQGIGEALLRASIAHARQHGAQSLRLEVRTDNTSAIALYEKLGFAKIAHLAHYYADQGDGERWLRKL
jgi:[ribosomal protein S18]-alanine N-acetyltransferase